MPVMFPVAECVGFHTFFGKIRDSNITFVIDTSESMICHLDTIKKHLCEALLSKAYNSSNSLFNIIGFSHKVTKWCDRMVTCSPNVVLSAMDWIRSLVCMPGRDLLQALIAALDDPLCQAVYLVTDGLPINNLKETVQVVSCMSQGRPLHIFFLSEKHFDHDVQDYLHELARYTRGSCHLITLAAGEIKQVIPTYNTECSNTGPFYSDLKYCSAKATMAPCVYMDSHQCCSGQVCTPCHATRRLYQLCPVSVCENADFIEGSLDSRHLATGTRVLARREPDGFYYLGSIKQEIEGRKGVFLIDFEKPSVSDGTCTITMHKTPIVDIIHYNEGLRHNIVPRDQVLAPWEKELLRYGPGSVLSGIETRDPLRVHEDEDIIVRFWNGKEVKVPKGVAFWIPPTLYDRIVRELQHPVSLRKDILPNEIVYPEVRTVRTVMPSTPCYNYSFCSGHLPSCRSCSCHKPCMGTCYLPAFPACHYPHQYQTWQPLMSKPAQYQHDAKNEELEKKVTAQLKELEFYKKESSSSSSCSSSSSEDESESNKEITNSKRVVKDRAVNTDSSLFQRRKSPVQEKPDWKYWKRSNPEPHHKKTVGLLSGSGMNNRSSPCKDLYPELWPAQTSNSTAVFNCVEHSAGPRVSMRDALWHNDFSPSVGAQGPPVQDRLGENQVNQNLKYQETLEHKRKKKIDHYKWEKEREDLADVKYSNTYQHQRNRTQQRLHDETQKKEEQTKKLEDIKKDKQLQKKSILQRMQLAINDIEGRESKKLASLKWRRQQHDAIEAQKVRDNEANEKLQQDTRRQRVKEFYMKEAEKVYQAEKEHQEKTRRDIFRTP